MSADFERFDPADVRDVVGEFPLAWVCAVDGQADSASLLPLLGEYDETGTLTHLFGHMALRSPLYLTLQHDPRALILFQGPQGYVSVADAGRRDWAPTWNFVQLRVEVVTHFVPDETPASLMRLLDKMEPDTQPRWSVEELGARYEPMRRRIIAFRAEVRRLSGRFKLAQDEDDATLAAILKSIDDPVMARWVRRFNRDRISRHAEL